MKSHCMMWQSFVSIIMSIRERFFWNRYSYRYGMPLVFLKVCLIIDFPPSLGIIVSWNFWAGLWIVIGPGIERSTTRKKITRLLLEGQNKAMFGTHVLKFLPDSIVETTEHGEISVTWNAVEKIVKTDDMIYIYGSAVTAYLVPRRAFQAQEAFDGFFEMVEKLKRQATG